MADNDTNSETNSNQEETSIIVNTDLSELKPYKKILAVVVMISLMIGGMVVMFGYWPDRLPESGSSLPPLYQFCFGKVRLIDSAMVLTDTIYTDTTQTSRDTIIVGSSASSTSSAVFTIDTNKHAKAKSIQKTIINKHHTIHLNTLLFILVALAGFLGNMIFIATSFTTYVALKKFDQSWLPWYFVKPFTAAILSVIVYLAFSAGFFSMNSGHTDINLFGIIALSFIVGLATDRATEKLKELIDVFMKPKEPRPGDTDKKPKIKSISPASLKKAIPNRITLTGENLMDDQLKIFIEDTQINFSERSSEKIMLDYTLPAVFEKSTVLLKISLKAEKIHEINLLVQV